MICGFCALLVLMAVLSFDSIRALNDLESGSARVRQEYLKRERTLRDIRFSLYESGNLLREFSLAPTDSATRESYRAQLHDQRDHATAALSSGLNSLPLEQRSPFQKLSDEMASYWLLADGILALDPRAKDDLSLRQLAHSQRTSVLTLAGEVSDINELDFREAEREISAVFASTRSSYLRRGEFHWPVRRADSSMLRTRVSGLNVFSGSLTCLNVSPGVLKRVYEVKSSKNRSVEQVAEFTPS